MGCASARRLCYGRHVTDDVSKSSVLKPSVLKQLAEEWIPFNRFMGLKAIVLDRGNIIFEIPYRDELIGDPMKRALHGGVLSMLADTAGGFAVWSALDDERARVSTIDLRVDYLTPGAQSAIRAHATLVRAGKTVGVSDIRLYHPNAESVTVATGKGVYAIRIAKG
jgi:uncharacterized protein (TIGR00369 family)